MTWIGWLRSPAPILHTGVTSGAVLQGAFVADLPRTYKPVAYFHKNPGNFVPLFIETCTVPRLFLAWTSITIT